MEICCIIPWRNRLSILQTVESLVKQQYPASEIIVVNYGGERNLELRIQSLGAKCIFSHNHGIFSRSHALNIGIRAAKGELVVICDGDIIYHQLYLSYLQGLHRENHKLALIMPVYDQKTGRCRNPKYCGPGLSTRKKWLVQINGYNEDMTGWSEEDVDIVWRLENYHKLNVVRRNPENIRNIHLSHPKSWRAPDYSEANKRIKDQVRSKKLYVANANRVWGAMN